MDQDISDLLHFLYDQSLFVLPLQPLKKLESVGQFASRVHDTKMGTSYYSLPFPILCNAFDLKSNANQHWVM